MNGQLKYIEKVVCHLCTDCEFYLRGEFSPMVHNFLSQDLTCEYDHILILYID